MPRTIEIQVTVGIACAAALACAIVIRPVAAQSGAVETLRTVQDGVFTEAQASRGGSRYAAECARCHEGADVDGPSLVGDRFVDRWREDTLDNLFTFISTRMPGDAPGKLDRAIYLDVLAFLLSENNMPAGARDLTTDALAGTLLVAKAGPQPLPAGALVQVVGCLARDAAGGWTLTHAARPSRIRNATQVSDADATRSATTALGSQTVALANLGDLGSAFVADAQQRHRVLVRGAFTRGPDTNRIRVISARSVADSCVP